VKIALVPAKIYFRSDEWLKHTFFEPLDNTSGIANCGLSWFEDILPGITHGGRGLTKGQLKNICSLIYDAFKFENRCFNMNDMLYTKAPLEFMTLAAGKDYPKPENGLRLMKYIQSRNYKNLLVMISSQTEDKFTTPISVSRMIKMQKHIESGSLWAPDADSSPIWDLWRYKRHD
jgi:hypothetical protein